MPVRKYVSLILVLMFAFTLIAYSVQAAEKTATKEEPALVGSAKGGKYHLPSCKLAKKIKPENMVNFKDAAEAEKKGYDPCKTCIPNQEAAKPDTKPVTKTQK
jgi:methylphosphotriester-DNA--protein-cysteine methyltransferase